MKEDNFKLNIRSKYLLIFNVSKDFTVLPVLNSVTAVCTWRGQGGGAGGAYRQCAMAGYD
jgi:hypothetical protein